MTMLFIGWWDQVCSMNRYKKQCLKNLWLIRTCCQEQWKVHIDVKDTVKVILGVPFANSQTRLFNESLTLKTKTKSQFCVSEGCVGFRTSVSGRIDSSVLSLFLLRCSFSLALSPSFCLSLLPVLAFLPSVVTSSSGDALRTKISVTPLPCVFYVREISPEFAYVQITSRWFEISHHQICSRQPYRFRFSVLQARHVRARFECPGTLRPLPSQNQSEERMRKYSKFLLDQ